MRKKRERKSARARARTRGEKTREREREKRESDESDNAVEGSEEYFDGERSEDARRVAGRAATTGRVDGEIQEELKRPSDCWYVPVCRVLGDSKEDA